jgi:hypothetical protein
VDPVPDPYFSENLVGPGIFSKIQNLFGFEESEK